MSRYPGWLLPVLALVVLGFVVWRVLARRFKSVREIVDEGRERQAARVRSMLEADAARVFALNVACKVCGAAKGELCSGSGADHTHLERYEDSDAEERRQRRLVALQ